MSETECWSTPLYSECAATDFVVWGVLFQSQALIASSGAVPIPPSLSQPFAYLENVEGEPSHSATSQPCNVSRERLMPEPLCTIAIIYQSHIHWGCCLVECCAILTGAIHQTAWQLLAYCSPHYSGTAGSLGKAKWQEQKIWLGLQVSVLMGKPLECGALMA